jgi:hypothetical protein
MQFNDLFVECLALWPPVVDLSDSSLTPNGGVRCPHLNAAWGHAETAAEPQGEWHALMTWLLFKSLHRLRLARNSFLHHVPQVTTAAVKRDLAAVRKDLLENLREDEYADMLSKYRRDNPSPC